MQIEDLLLLLREEFALDVPAARAAVAEWRHAPGNPAPAAQLLDFLNRALQASEVMGLQGFAGYLQQMHEFAAVQRAGADAASLAWLEGWLEPALTYLDQPASLEAVSAIVDYLAACPHAPDMQAVEALAGLLSVLPGLPDEDNPALNPLDAALAADVSLSTENVDMGLLSALLADSPEQLEKLGLLVDKLAEGSATEAELNEAQRIAHTFKGSGNIVGLPGIGKIAHRAEDILEYALQRVAAGEPVNRQMAQDTRVAVDTLAAMVSHLMGEELAPPQALVVLQRLLDWAQLIREGASEDAMLEPLALSAAAVSADAADNSAQFAAAAGNPGAAVGSDTASLRVSVDRLSRLLRRAGQSIVHAERLNQLMRNATERLNAVEENHEKLRARLRELETAVTRQVVHLQAQEQTGLVMDPLEMDRYDGLYSLSRFISEAAEDELELARQARLETERALTMMRDEGYALRDQHRELLDARLIPVKSIVPRLKRNVAQTASSTGKEVLLEIVGEQVTLDADVLIRLTEPLLHLLRNSVDHGIEPAEERELLGKPRRGVVTLTFARVGQEIDVICADDGTGLDLPTIYDKAIDYGLIPPGAALRDDEIRRLILRPGFSTKGEVTEVSGRGVGMDVVADRVAGLKGRLEIASQPFQGSQFTIRVPVSSGTAQALVVRVQDELVALTSEQVITALAADIATPDIAESGEDSKTVHVIHEGVRYPAYSLGSWLGFEDAATAANSHRQMVLAKGMGGTIALWVDAVVETRELILQDIGSLTRRIPGVAGGSLRSDGRPMFLLDIPELERAAKSSVHITASASLRQRMQVRRTPVMVVDDALSVRRSMQQLLEDAGYEVTAAMDGFDAIEKMRTTSPAIVLTDLEMPNLNGIDLTRRIREVPQFMQMPVVMITSRATDKHRQLALDAGVNVYLTKPYTDADLLAHVRSLLARGSAAATL
ncbi:MAG: response regulator [Polaromonas sp.]|nr:response regulator [Polaromonas sp.]